MSGKVVLVLHGLGDVRSRAEAMAKYLRSEGGYQAFCISYPSVFDDIGSHAKSLASVVAHLEGVEEINFVGHSMGNLVIRHYLGDQTDAATGRRPDPRIKRFVMIAPPNNGAELAVKYGDNPAFIALLGMPGQQLGKRWPEIAPQTGNARLRVRHHCRRAGRRAWHAGARGGDNDGVVTVASTRLSGARDFIVVPQLHFFILQAPVVMQYTLRFLKDGYFVAPDQRHPLEGERR